MILCTLTSTRYSAAIFITGLLLVYAAVPLTIESLALEQNYWFQLALMAIVAGVSIWIGFSIRLVDRQFDELAWRIRLDVRYLHMFVWAAFAVFVVVTVSTAPAIPIYSAIFGEHTAEQLDAQRGAFLKTREGWQAALLYLSTLFTGTLLPYSMARLFLDKSERRWWAMAGFIGYAELFLQKALFIQVVAPLFYLVIQRKIWNFRGLIVLILACVGILYLNTTLARGVMPPSDLDKIVEVRKQAEEEKRERAEAEQVGTGINLLPSRFFSAKFVPLSAKEHIVWRVLSVPIFTAADALRMFDDKFGGQFLLGATSTAIALLTGVPRIAYEINLFGYQWGYNEIAASNSVYFTEAFVNFGWLGVVIFSLAVGQAFRIFWKSRDDALKSMWPLFAFNIAQSGLIGSMLSNGYALLFLIGLFVSFESTRRSQELSRSPEPDQPLSAPAE